MNLIDTEFETIIEEVVKDRFEKKYYRKPKMKWVVNRQIVNSVGNL